MEVKKVLCAVDLEDTIAPSVEYAKMMASMTGASILVAYVIPAHTPYEDVYLSVNNQPNEVNNPNETIQKSMNARNSSPGWMPRALFLWGGLPKSW